MTNQTESIKITTNRLRAGFVRAVLHNLQVDKQFEITFVEHRSWWQVVFEISGAPHQVKAIRWGFNK